MKRSVISFGCLLAALGFLIFPNTNENQYTVASNVNYDGTQTFLATAAGVFNQSPLEVQINDTLTSFDQGQEPYADANAVLMYPVSVLREQLDCLVLQYKDGRLIIQKGDLLLELNVNETAGSLNGEPVALTEDIVSDQGQVFVPIEDIAKLLGYDATWKKFDHTLSLVKADVDDALPAKYDYRDWGRATPVRDQGALGTCWAFAALGAIESSLLPGEELILSPNHMSQKHAFNMKQADGGEYNMAVAYLASWKGPVLESEAPYGNSYSPDHLAPTKHLEEAIMLPKKDYTAIKKAVFQIGGVETSIFTSLTDSSSSSTYYSHDNSAYYYNGKEESNHDVVIVGWDDTYSKENFTIPPAGNGAFICKNSWGTSFGEDGYFYISYYDTNLGKDNVVYSKVVDNNYDNIYQTDQLGWVGQLGYNSETAYFSNVYTTKGQEQLSAVSFYATERDTKYEVYVVRNFDGKDSLERREQVTEGSFDYKGYYTVQIPEPIQLSPNETFAVVVKITTPNTVQPVAVEYNADSRYSTFDISDGEGYISMDGQRWDRAETSQECNVCLKAFTEDIE